MPNKFKYVIILYAAVILIYLYLAKYSLPCKDDYAYILMRQTMSSVQVSIHEYLRWNGRLVANFLYAFFLPSLNYTQYKLAGAFNYVALCVGFAALFFSTNLPKKTAFYMYILCLGTIFTSINSSRENFYWVGGYANYTFAVTFFLYSLIPFVRKFKYKAVIVAAASIACALSSMCNEMFTPVACFFMSAAAVVFYLRKDSYRFKIAVLFAIILAAGILIMFLSPGNSVRDGGREQLSLFMIFWKSLMTTLERSGEWLFISPLIPCAMIISTLIKDYKLKIIDRLSYKQHALLFLAVALICCYIPHFIHASTLARPGLPARAKFINQIFFQMLMLPSIIYFIRSIGLESKILKNIKIQKVIIVAVFFMFIISKDFFPSMLYAGKMQGYYDSIVMRIELMRRSPGEIVEIVPYPYQPPFMRDDYFNYMFAEQQAIVTGCAGFNVTGKDGYANFHFSTWDLGRKKW